MMKYTTQFSWIFSGLLMLGTFSWAPSSLADPNCESVRAGFDVGSSGIKMKIAKIDICTRKITKVLMEERQDVPFRNDLGNIDGQDPDLVAFSANVQMAGLKAFQKLKEDADQFAATNNLTLDSYVGVATEAFRMAQGNADKFLSVVADRTGISVHVIDQKTEGAIEFMGVLATQPGDIDSNKVIAIGIGGGSMQVGARNKQGKLIQYLGKKASDEFKLDMIALEGKDSHFVKSPNPVSAEDLTKGIQHGKEITDQFSPELRAKFQESGVEVYAVGGVQNLGVKGAIETLVNNAGQATGALAALRSGRPKDSAFTEEKLAKAMDALVGKSDENIAGLLFNDNGQTYENMRSEGKTETDIMSQQKKDKLLAANSLSNLILVGSIVDQEQIKEVKYTKVNLTDGLFFMSDFMPEVSNPKVTGPEAECLKAGMRYQMKGASSATLAALTLDQLKLKSKNVYTAGGAGGKDSCKVKNYHRSIQRCDELGLTVSDAYCMNADQLSSRKASMVYYFLLRNQDIGTN